MIVIRHLLLGIWALIAFVAPAKAQSTVDRGVREAFLFAFPVYQIARTRAEAIATARSARRTVINTFGHRARLAGPQDRLVTTPNNDTLYSSAWLDLSEGPVVLTMPALPDRYHSVALMDIFTDNFAVLGTRANRGRGGTYLITGPGWRGRVPNGMRRVASPTNDVWALARILIDGPADLPAAANAQARFKLAPLAGQPSGERATLSVPPRTPDGRRLLLEANALLGRGAIPTGRARTAARLAPYGIGPGRDTWDTLNPAVRDSWTRQLPGLVAALRGGFASVGRLHDGWSYPRPGMGRFGTDEFYRAAVALGGLAALPVEEAIYLTAATDVGGAPLDGARRYRLTLPADVPVDAFWSLSMYEVSSDGRLFFTVNAIDRYAVGDRTPGLIRNADGGVTLLLQHDAPRAGRENWLPTPNGPFKVTFRGYLPRAALRDGRFRLSGLRLIDQASITSR